MATYIYKAIILTSLLTGLASNTQADQVPQLTVPSKQIPLPAGASQALRDAITEFTPRQYEDEVSNVPKDKAQWLALIQQANAEQKKKVKAMKKQFGVEVELLELNGVKVRKITPPNPAPELADMAYIDIHGGAYILFGGLPSIEEGILVAARVGMTVFSVDYRMPPAHPYPAALEDTVKVYQALLAHYSSDKLVMGGTSAGGGLTVATTQHLAKLNLPLPRMLYLGTPWVDLTKTGDTQFSNEILDRILVTYDGTLGGAAQLYAGKRDIDDPLLSPLYASVEGFPPVYLVSGTRDMFLSDTVRLNRKLRDAGVDTVLDVYEGVSHADYLVAYQTPESESVYKELATMIKRLAPPNSPVATR